MKEQYRKKEKENLLQSPKNERFLTDIIEMAQQPVGIGYPDSRFGFCSRVHFYLIDTQA